MNNFEVDVIDRLARIETQQIDFARRLGMIESKSSKLGGIAGSIAGGLIALVSVFLRG